LLKLVIFQCNFPQVTLLTCSYLTTRIGRKIGTEKDPDFYYVV